MKIETVRLSNYAGHRDLVLELQGGFNCLVGVNGSGKTSILRAICNALIFYTNYLPSANNNLGDDFPDSIAHVKVEKHDGKFRFEPQFPFGVEVFGEAFGEQVKWTSLKRHPGAGFDVEGVNPGMVLQKIQQTFGNGPNWEERYPLVAFYRANRMWVASEPNQLAAATTRESRFDGLTRWFDASVDSSGLQRWVISKSLERLEYCVNNGIRFEDVTTDELAVVNAALAKALEGAKGLRYDMSSKQLLMEWDADDINKQAVPFRALSDGQRAFVALISDIARRMCLLNPQMGLQVISHTDGIILIDELDMHLHPRWQRLIAIGLKRAFPSIQFIVASHSPLVIGSLQTKEIMLLQQNGVAQPKVSYGMDPSEIIQEIMGSHIRPDEVEGLISELYNSLDKNELVKAKKLLSELQEIAPGIHDISSAAALLKRKEILGK